MGALTELALEFLKNGILAVLAAWIAVRISIRKFSTQRWWERQEAAYSEIVESLAEMKYLLVKLEEAEPGEATGPRQYGLPEKEEIWSKVMQRAEALSRLTYQGAFRISPTSLKALKELVWSLYPTRPVGDYDEVMAQLNKYKEQAAECLQVVDREAHKDLRLPKSHKFKR